MNPTNHPAPFGRLVRRSTHAAALLPSGDSIRRIGGCSPYAGSPRSTDEVDAAARAVASAPLRELEADAAYKKMACCEKCGCHHSGECA